MKKIAISILILFFGMHTVNSQDVCSKYYPMSEGASFQYTIYNKKGKTDGITDYTITNVNNSGGETSATFKMQFTDDKGKQVFDSEYDIACTGDGIKIDYASLMPTQMMEQYQEMDLKMDITGTDIELPNNLAVGQKLSDANVAVSMDMGVMKMNIQVDMTDRKVEKRESVTTPAGTFDCYLITEKNNSKTMGANIEMNSKLWLAEGVGMVKQESYKSNGNLMSRSELTKYSK